jgi:predicted Fe-Mo cluster-binding NifX family protein
MKSVKVAVATTDGKHVNAHFGRAEHFSIFALGGEVTFIEARACEKLSTGDPTHAFDPAKFEKIADMLKDCQKVYVADIGQVPETELKARGLEVIRCRCLIDQIGRCGGNCNPILSSPQ